MRPTSVASALMCTRWLLSCELCKGHMMCRVVVVFVGEAQTSGHNAIRYGALTSVLARLGLQRRGAPRCVCDCLQGVVNNARAQRSTASVLL
jgi:hypothetical protein